MHSDNQKRCGFRYATAAPLLDAGDVWRCRGRFAPPVSEESDHD